MGSQGNRPAKERVYEHIKSRIIGSSILPGSFVTESEIAEEIGVSRTPVREAFLRLEAERLLRLVPRKGAFVVPISAQELEEVMEARMVIELFAVERLANRHLPVADRLGRIIESQRRLIADGDTQGFIDLDRDLHRVLVGAAGNEVLAQLYDSLRDHQLRMGVAAVAGNEVRLREVLREHEAIRSAAEAWDAEALKEAIRNHLLRTRAVLRPRPSFASDPERFVS